jgi:hypothetical protein
MPVRKVQGGYRWGNSGKVYPTKAQAERQGRAIHASGYQDGGIVDVRQGDDPSVVDRVRNFMGATMTDRFGLPVTTDWERPEKPMLTPAQTAYLAAQLDPTVMTGLVDVTGGYPSFPGPDVPPEEAFSGEPMPGFAENVREGNLGIAALQTLGLIPGIGMLTRGRKVVKAASDVARASRSSETARIPALSVREGEVPNMSSISASLYNYEVLPGIRSVRIKDFETDPHKLFYAKDDLDHVNRLAQEIRESGEISPLIVVRDSDGPYILEGGHRLAALGELGVEEFPAIVVRDLD